MDWIDANLGHALRENVRLTLNTKNLHMYMKQYNYLYV